MSKCRYDLSEDCNNKDCLNCVLGKIKAEIIQMPTISFNANDIYKADVLAIIGKYRTENHRSRYGKRGKGMKNIETVKDLIEELQKLPSDAYISLCDYDGDFEAEIRWDITPEMYEEGYEDQPYIYLTRPSSWRGL